MSSERTPLVTDEQMYAACSSDADMSLSELRDLYEAALYHERSKRPPMISVEEAMEAVKEWMNNDGERKDEPSGAISLFHGWDQLRERLTAAATNNTNDNDRT